MSPFIRRKRKSNPSSIGTGAATQENHHGTFDEKVFVIVTLTTTFAVPAFAQQAPNSRQDAQTSRRSLRVHVYAPNYYQPWYGNQNLNPDFQLGYTR